MIFNRKKKQFNIFSILNLKPQRRHSDFLNWMMAIVLFVVVATVSFLVFNFYQEINQTLKSNGVVSIKKNNPLSDNSLLSQLVSGLGGDLYNLLGFQGEKHYLLIFENNLEMRPTGGFIGSYGLITVSSGRIKNVFIDDIYNLDKLSEGKLKVSAPEAIKKYNQQEWWFMRDANWSPDWPTSAQKILWFFNEENKNAKINAGSIDGVIAVTPNVISDLMSLSGPIEVNGQVFKAENFAVDLEKFVEFDYRDDGIHFNQRKEIIGTIASTLIQKMENWPLSSWLKAAMIIKNDLASKQVLLYATNPSTQEKFLQQGWSGEIKKTDGDYLMVADANLAALKTDLVMEKSLAYDLRVDNGQLIGRLQATYHHQGKSVEGLISRYRDYVRVYLPLGAELSVVAIKKGDNITNLQIGRDMDWGMELDKSFAGVFLTVEPDETVSLILEYRLPLGIAESYQNGQYQIMVQKQAGTIGHKFEIHLNLNKPIIAYQADNAPSSLSRQAVWWQTDLSVDREFLVKF